MENTPIEQVKADIPTEKKKKKVFTQDDIDEMEIIDAYYKEVGSYYSKKRKIII